MAHHGIFVVLFMALISSSQVSAQLSADFYATICPSVFDTIRAATRSAIIREARMGASLIRLFFHDCFVNGCDASVLLDDNGAFVGEKNQVGNRGSLRGFEVIDSIKARVDRACGGSVVSCADIVAVAARDSVAILGGPSYAIPVGRKDAQTVNIAGINDLPAFFEDLDPIIAKFAAKGFTAREMVALSGAHTVGQARCATFRERIYNETNINPLFSFITRIGCPRVAPNGDGNLAPFDAITPNRFDNSFFRGLVRRRGLLHTDQGLFSGGSTDAIVTTYSNNPTLFSTDFANAMVKMGNLGVLTSAQGEVRTSCRRIN